MHYSILSPRTIDMGLPALPPLFSMTTQLLARRLLKRALSTCMRRISCARCRPRASLSGQTQSTAPRHRHHHSERQHSSSQLHQSARRRLLLTRNLPRLARIQMLWTQRGCKRCARHLQRHELLPREERQNKLVAHWLQLPVQLLPPRTKNGSFAHTESAQSRNSSLPCTTMPICGPSRRSERSALI